MATDNRVDRISELSTHLIGNIFDRLPIRDAARTCVLSSKWRYLWSLQPHIVFDDTFFQRRRNPSRAELANAVSQVLLKHSGQNLQKFALETTRYSPISHGDVDQWLLYLSKASLLQLSLALPSYNLPPWFFSFSTLRDLRLNDCVFVDPPASFEGFPHLITLFLRKVTFQKHPKKDALVVCMPDLENFTLADCSGTDHLSIEVPKLEKLEVAGEFTGFFCFLGNPGLKDVSINVSCVKNIGLCGSSSLHHESFRDVISLCLNGVFLKMIYSPDWRARFEHLENLTLWDLDHTDEQEADSLLQLLRSSHNLRKLYLQIELSSNTMTDSKLPSRFLMANNCKENKYPKLQIVKFASRSISNIEMLLIKLLLDSSPSLEKMTIEVADYNLAVKVTKELLRFPRASPAAEIMFMAVHPGPII